MIVRRTPLLKVLCIVLVALAGVAAGTWIWVKSVEARHWSRMERRVAELRAELDARCGPRPVLRGTPVPGNAWDDYLPAIELVDRIQNCTVISHYVFRSKDGDRDKARPLIAAQVAAVELMQKGTRRATVGRVRLHEKEPLFELGTGTPADTAGRISVLAVGRARLLAEEGKVHDSVELLLDVCQFGRDLTADGSAIAEIYGTPICREALNELKDLFVMGKVSPADGRQLEAELGQLEASFPRHEAAILGQLEWIGKLILSDRMIPELSKPKPLPPEARPSWRHAYSWRLLLAAAFDQADASVARVRDADRGSYREELKNWDAFYADLKASKNPFAEVFGSMVEGGHRTPRERLTQIRLLRTAAHYVATGEILELDDPFGAKLFHRLEGDKLRLWGVGMNLKDDGGKGIWQATNPDDIVLEIPK